MKISELDRDDLVYQRKRIEARITRTVIKAKATIFTLPIGNDGRVLSFSPYTVNTMTDILIKSQIRWKYSHISNRLHIYEDERYKLEVEMRKIINFREDTFIHLVLNRLVTYEGVYEYCTQSKLPMISKQDFNKLLKLIKKWKEASKDLHYKPSKQEKRKLKKLVVNSNDISRIV